MQRQMTRARRSTTSPRAAAGRPVRRDERKAAVILDRIARDYPQGVDSLFSGANLSGVRRTGANLAAALRRGDISAGSLYEGTLGAYDDLSGNSLGFQILDAQAAAANKQNAATGKDKTKFENIMNTLLGTAAQAVDIYNKAKNPGAYSEQAPPPPASKPLPWLWIAAGVAVILVVALVFLKKK